MLVGVLDCGCISQGVLSPRATLHWRHFSDFCEGLACYRHAGGGKAATTLPTNEPSCAVILHHLCCLKRWFRTVTIQYRRVHHAPGAGRSHECSSHPPSLFATACSATSAQLVPVVLSLHARMFCLCLRVVHSTVPPFSTCPQQPGRRTAGPEQARAGVGERDGSVASRPGVRQGPLPQGPGMAWQSCLCGPFFLRDVSGLISASGRRHAEDKRILVNFCVC